MAEQTAEVFLRQLERLSSFPTDFDEEFFDKFAESYLPTDQKGLLLVSQSLARSPLTPDIIHALFLKMTRKIAAVESPESVFQVGVVTSFLGDHWRQLVGSESPMVQQLLVELLADMEAADVKQELSENLPRELLTLLASERTALSVRRAVENFYIVLQRHSPSAFQTIVAPLYNVLLASDYPIMIDSVARILVSDAEASATSQQFEGTLEKLKESRTAGRPFVQLVADMICRSSYGTWSQLSESFRSKPVHANLLDLITKQSTETSKFPRSRLVELLRSVAGEKVDLYIDYVVEEALQNPKEGMQRLMPLVAQLSEPRNCSEATLKKFFNVLQRLPGSEGAYLSVVKALESRIMRTPSTLLCVSEEDEARARFLESPEISQLLLGWISEALEPSSSNEKWEHRDSAIEILTLLTHYAEIDIDAFAGRLMDLVRSDPSHFVRISAGKLLCDRFPQVMARDAVAVFRENVDKHIRLPIIEMLRCRRFNGEPDPIVASAAKEILDEVWHREDDSDVRGAAVRVYDALFDAFSDTETEERRRQRDTLGEERQNELQERQRRLQRREDIRVEVEDIIETMKHSCDEHDCVSKECY